MVYTFCLLLSVILCNKYVFQVLNIYHISFRGLPCFGMEFARRVSRRAYQNLKQPSKDILHLQLVPRLKCSMFVSTVYILICLYKRYINSIIICHLFVNNRTQNAKDIKIRQDIIYNLSEPMPPASRTSMHTYIYTYLYAHKNTLKSFLYGICVPRKSICQKLLQPHTNLGKCVVVIPKTA